MSCITVPRQWGRVGTVAPRVEAVPLTARIQRRTTKKARATPALVDTVREVVQAFEFEYAQVRAESVQLKIVLDERRTQLSDLRRHLEKESSENGTLEAVVQHRSEKNKKGDTKLAALELDFSVIVGDDRVIASRLAGFESDLAVMTQEYRRAKEQTSFVATQLDRVEAALDQREHTVAAVLRESERLRGEVEDGRTAVEEKQCLVRAKQERASWARSLAKEAAVELEVLNNDTSMLEEEVIGKESQCEAAVVALEAINLQASEARLKISEERACRAAGVAVSQSRLAELKQQIAAQEKSKADLEERIQTAHDAITSEAEVHAKKRDEIAAIQSDRQESVEAAKLELSGQLDYLAKEVAQAESAVTDSSERIRQANTEFSNLMAAMSAAFKEYDKAVTTNRELERGTTEAESALNSLRETTQRELSVLSEKHDRLSTSNAEEHLALDAAAKRKAELDDALCVTQSALTAVTAEVESSRMKVVDGKERVRDLREAKRMEVEKRMEAARLAKVAEIEAKEAVVVARARLDQQQIELIELDRATTQWHPPPVELSTNDLERVEEEAKVVVKSMRKSDDEAHAIRLQSLKDTLTTITEGGEARLKAEKDAAAARLAALQGQIREVSQSLTELRSRIEEAAREEVNIHQELSRRAVEKRRAAEQQEAAAASAAAHAATAAKTAAAAARFMTPEARSTNHLSVGLRTPSARPVTHVRTQPPPPKQQIVPVSVPTEALVMSSFDRYGGQVREVGDRKTQERESAGQVERDSSRTEADDGQSKQQQQQQQPRQPVMRSKKSSFSSSKDRSARSSQQRQIASESTAEAAGSRHRSTSAGRKHSGSKSSSSSKRKDKDRDPTLSKTTKSSNRVAATTDESSLNDMGRSNGNPHKSSEGTKRASKSLSKSPRPRPRPRSPRPANKEYDLWTDNSLVGDSEFSFF